MNDGPSTYANNQSHRGNRSLSVWSAGGGETQLVPSATVFYDTLERSYPMYPEVDDLKLGKLDLELWLDMRPYMDQAPYTMTKSASVHRCYKLFRTMGLRHLVVVDTNYTVVGMIARQDITEHNLHHHWSAEGNQLQKFINVEPTAPAVLINGHPVIKGNQNHTQDHHGHPNGDHLHQYDATTHYSSSDTLQQPQLSEEQLQELSPDPYFADPNDDFGRLRADTVQSVDPSAGLSASPTFGAYRKTMTAAPRSTTSLNPDLIIKPIKAQIGAVSQKPKL